MLQLAHSLLHLQRKTNPSNVAQDRGVSIHKIHMLHMLNMFVDPYVAQDRGVSIHKIQTLVKPKPPLKVEVNPMRIGLSCVM